MIGQTVAAAVGTIAFSLLYNVPKKYYVYCGITGGSGWFLYSLLTRYAGATATEATFFATVLVIVMSRFFAVWERCPVTVFLISGIFPLVPGAGIYWTAYYLVTNELRLALMNGFAALKAAVAIVLGIVLVFESPYGVFRIKRGGKSRR